MITNKPIIGHIIPFSRGDGEHRAQNRGFVRVIGPRGGCLGAFFACSARSGPNCSDYRGRGSPATRKIVRVRPRQPGESGFEPGVQRRGITSSLTIVLLRPPRPSCGTIVRPPPPGCPAEQLFELRRGIRKSVPESSAAGVKCLTQKSAFFS